MAFRQMLLLIVLVALCAVCLAQYPRPPPQLRLNEIQVVTTVQSFHLAPAPEVAAWEATWASTAAINSWDFSHLTLTQQLNAGIRGFELCIYQDPMGGHFIPNAGLKLGGVSGIDNSPGLKWPGYKVLNQQDFDFGTTCNLLADCLKELLAWSNAHPHHIPITIVFHAGSSSTAEDILGSSYAAQLAALQASTLPGPKNFTVPTDLGGESDPSLLFTFEAYVTAALGSNKLIRPDDLRGSAATLSEAILPPNGQWPLVNNLLGKFLLVLDPDFTQGYYNNYKNSSVGATLFMSDDEEPSNPDVVFLDSSVDADLLNASAPGYTLSSDANAQVDALAAATNALVKQGFMVRAGMERHNVESHFDYAYRGQQLKAAGAHYLMTYNEVPPPYNRNYQFNPKSIFGPKIDVSCNPVTYADYTKTCGGRDACSTCLAFGKPGHKKAARSA